MAKIKQISINNTVYDIEDASAQPALVSGTNIKTVNGVSVVGSGDVSTTLVATVTESNGAYASDKLFSELNAAFNAGISVYASYMGVRVPMVASSVSTHTALFYGTLDGDAANITIGNMADKVYVTITSKQDTLVSGTNIKTINGSSIVGSGDVGLQEKVRTKGVNYMGYKTLSPSASFASQVTETDTIYVIQYSYDLNGQTVTIPSGCVLQFDGGSISNGTLVGTNTRIDAGLEKIFGTDINFSGSWDITSTHPEWFGALGDGTNDDTDAIQKAVDLASVSNVNNTQLLSKTYKTTGSLTLNSRARLYCDRYASKVDNTPFCKIAYYGNGAAIVLTSSVWIERDISIQNIGIQNLGNSDAIGIRFGETDYVNKTFLSNTISSCHISGFKYGIYASINANMGFTSSAVEKCHLVGNKFGIYITASDSTAYFVYNSIKHCDIISNNLWGIYVSGARSVSNRICECDFEANGVDYAYSDYDTYGSGAVRGGGFEITGCYIEGNTPSRAGNTYDDTVEEVVSGSIVPINRDTKKDCACFYGNAYNIHDNYINQQRIIISSVAPELRINCRNNTIMSNAGIDGFIYAECTSSGSFKQSEIIVHEIYRNTSYTRVFDRFVFDNTKAHYLVSDCLDIQTNFPYEKSISPSNETQVVYVGTNDSRTGYGQFVSFANSSLSGIAAGVTDWRNSVKTTEFFVLQNTSIGYGTSTLLRNKRIIIEGNNYTVSGYIGGVGFALENSTVIIKNVKFDSSSQLLALGDNNKVTFVNCTFSNCTQPLINVSGGKRRNIVSVENCTFDATNASSFKVVNNWLFRDCLITESGNTYATSNVVLGLQKYSGAFSAKPSSYYPLGNTYYATDRNAPIFWNGTEWYNVDGSKAQAIKSGTTANRPASTDIYTGFQYWDTTLGKMIAWNGSAWVNLDGTALS